MVRFAAFTFQPDSGHEFKAVASYPDTSAEAVKPEVIFSLTVKPTAPPAAAIVGPDKTSLACEFSLSAECSQDLSLPPTEPARLTFEWSCTPRRSSTPCYHLSNF